MLPTCIGISGVSRYRNDASIEESFLASAIFSSRSRKRGALAALRASQMSLLLDHIRKPLTIVQQLQVGIFRDRALGSGRQDCAFSGGP
jgi:hypothetical protein